MSVSSSIYVGVTGVMAHQENMSVISDNIANVSTVGFKSSRMLFGTLMSEQMAASTVENQIGKGVGISSIYRDMSVGALETTNTATDISIGGYGFFMVSPENSTDTYFTRAGNFRFDNAGYLRDPSGNILQGYRLPQDTVLDGGQTLPEASVAPLEDIQLVTQGDGVVVSEPEATTEIRMSLNLDSGSDDSSQSTTSPFTAMFDNWDATQEEPLDAGDYAYESSLRIYDENGESHVLRAFFDPVGQMDDNTSGNRVWEYLVTIPPDEDVSGLDTKKGVLMAGTMTFTPAGELLSMSAFSGTSDDKSTWTPVELSDGGYPILTATVADAAPITSVLDLGLTTDVGWGLPDGVTSMADLDTSYLDLPTMRNAQRGGLSVTNFSSASSTIFQDQNGYEQGFLQSVNVETDGTIIGNFSNGQKQALYQIPLADFINPQGLFREGGNLFSATSEAGAATLGWASEGRLGGIVPNSLENSNVDLATEFVHMIITQRGFDANSKVITTSDQVVQTAIQMKR
jgi:flagellar hook protein FlgE